MRSENTYVEIDLDAIEANLDAVAARAGIPVMGIVKADAYGHGAVPVAQLLKEKCRFFGVSSVAEAMELRGSGIENPILILGHTPPDAFDQVVRWGLRPAIFRWEDAQALSQEATRQNRTAPFHFAVDTGMGRIGFPCTRQAAQQCLEIAKLPGLEAEGLFSHYATADSADLSAAKVQAERFAQFDRWLQELGLHIPLRHLDNSAGLMNFGPQYEMVRSGIITYGLYPSEEVNPAALALKPALSWFSRISHLKTLPAGCPISYGGAYVTTGETRVATIPVGYADGYRRSLSGQFYVLIRGKRAPILGRICMDQMMVDVTDIADAALGDRVTLIGTDGAECITVGQIAQTAGSFHYEWICGISRRVPRIYRRNGQAVHTVHYLLDNLSSEESH